MDRLDTKHIMVILYCACYTYAEGLGASKGGLVDRLNTEHIMPILEDLVPAKEDWWIDLILCILYIFWRTWCQQGRTGG